LLYGSPFIYFLSGIVVAGVLAAVWKVRWAKILRRDLKMAGAPQEKPNKGKFASPEMPELPPLAGLV
jgi:hypothetical protein